MIYAVVGARPNFMKMAPVVHALQRRGLPYRFIHTGQHYDHAMSQVFFDELALPQPDVYLGVGGGSHAEQTAKVMIAIEQLCVEQRPDLLLVAGDVNSTLAAALAAAKLNIPIAHIEAGLRSNERTMPEEINRIVVDQLSDLLFTTEEAANSNLAREGVAGKRVYFVGNCMVDTLLQHVKAAVDQAPWRQWNFAPSQYAVATLHRPQNVDDAATLRKVLQIINNVARDLPVIFPVHPRTRTRLAQTNVILDPRVVLTEPLGYLPFLGLMARSALVLTDSGGIQEETTALGVPCLTLRHTTERPVTITSGTNLLVGTDAHLVAQSVGAILAGTWKRGTRPALWDGHAAERIVDVIDEQSTMSNEQRS